MADTLIKILNDYKQNYPFCRLTLLVESVNTNSLELTNYKFNKGTQIFCAYE